MDNLGAYQLRRVYQPQRTIAGRIAVNHGTVSKWRAGHLRPSFDNRRILEAELGIPLGAWDERAPLAPGAAA